MKYTLIEWREEGNRRFGDDIEDWKFVCPACGRVNTGQEFKDLGATPDDSYTTCIGRHNGKGVTPNKSDPKYGCDWAAFGLFGTMGKGDIVVTDDGKETHIFAFAEV